MPNIFNGGDDINLDQSPQNTGQGTGVLDQISNTQQDTPPVDNTGQGDTQDLNNSPPVDNTGQGDNTHQDIDYKAEYEKLKKSYDHLRPEYTRVTQQLSNLRRQSQTQPPNSGTHSQQNTQDYINAPQPNVPQTQFYQDQNTGNIYYIDTNGQPVLYNAHLTGITQNTLNNQDIILEQVNKMIQPLYEQNLETQMQNEIAKMAIQNSDFDEVAPIMTQVLTEMPQLWELGQAKALEVAYRVGKTKIIEQQMTNVVNDAKNSVLQNKDVKVLTGGNYTKPNQSNNQVTQADAIKQSILGGVNSSTIF